MRISACSIVKNEEKNIARSIESYRDVVDEIIIVDTGSTDRTIEICEELGAKVICHEWENDFAKAKNIAINEATGDWIIFLDADEWFEPALDNRIFDALKQAEAKKVQAIKNVLCNIEESTGDVCSEVTIARIFKKEPNIKYEGKIHEDLRDNGKLLVAGTADEIKIYHSGYSADRLSGKATRNLEILNNIYQKGGADTKILFYLCRENAITGSSDEAMKFYDLFMKQDDHDEVIKGANAYITIYELGNKIRLSRPNQFTMKEQFEMIDEGIEKFPEIPIHYYLKGCECAWNDLYGAIEYYNKALKKHENYDGKYINNFIGMRAENNYRLGKLYKIGQVYDKAFDCLVESLKENKHYKEAFAALLPLIRNEEPVEIIMFLNKIYDNQNKEDVKFLTHQFVYSKCHQVFLYYANKLNKEFDEEDETTFLAMMLSGEADKVCNIAEKAYLNAGKEDDRYFIALAMIYGKRMSLFEQYNTYLNRTYARITKLYLQKEKLKNPSQEEIEAWTHLYGRLFYLLPENELEAFEDLFEEMPIAVAKVIIEGYLTYQNYSLIEKKCKWLSERVEKSIFELQFKKIKAFCKYYMGQYEESVELIDEVLNNSDIDLDDNIILISQAISSLCETPITRRKAALLYKRYKKVFVLNTEIMDMLRTGKIESIDGGFSISKIKKLSADELREILDEENVKIPNVALGNLFNLMEEYLNRQMDEDAFGILVKLLQQEYRKDIVYYRMAEICNRTHNVELSEYLHRKVFEENPVFASTIIGDKSNPNHDYVYRETQTIEQEKCPICGKDAALYEVYNAILSKDFSEIYPAIKKWRYCKSCHHKFAGSITTIVKNEEVDEKKAKEIVLSIGHNCDKSREIVEQIGKYKENGELLNLSRDYHEILLVAEEYGYKARGLEQRSNVAKKVKDKYGLNIDEYSLNDLIKQNQKYDIITDIDLVEKCTNPQEHIMQLYDLLNNEGILYIETPNCESAMARLQEDRAWELRSSLINNYFSRSSLKKMLTACGFKLVEYQTVKENKGNMLVIAQK